MKYLLLADHDCIDQVEVIVYAKNNDHAVELVTKMGFWRICMCIELPKELDNE
jgi:hypothetical protein